MYHAGVVRFAPSFFTFSSFPTSSDQKIEKCHCFSLLADVFQSLVRSVVMLFAG